MNLVQLFTTENKTLIFIIKILLYKDFSFIKMQIYFLIPNLIKKKK